MFSTNIIYIYIYECIASNGHQFLSPQVGTIPYSQRVREFFQRYPGAMPAMQQEHRNSDNVEVPVNPILPEMYVESQWRLDCKASETVEIEEETSVRSMEVEVGSRDEERENEKENPPRGSVVNPPLARPASMSSLREVAVDTEAQKAVRDEIKALENQKKKPRKGKKTTPTKDQKSKGTKRRLEPEFEVAAGGKENETTKPPIVISPKAKRMAGRISEEDSRKANEARKDRACSALAELSGLPPLDGLHLPDLDTFDKM